MIIVKLSSLHRVSLDPRCRLLEFESDTSSVGPTLSLDLCPFATQEGDFDQRVYSQRFKSWNPRSQSVTRVHDGKTMSV